MVGDAVAFEFDDDRVAGGISAFENESNHSTVGNSSVNLNIVVGFDLSQAVVIDLLFGVTHVGRVAHEFCLQIGRKGEVGGGGEGLEDLCEENVFIAEELKRLLIERSSFTVPEIVQKYPGREFAPCIYMC